MNPTQDGGYNAAILRFRLPALVFIVYAVLAIALTYPLSLHPADHVMSQGTDTNLFIWTIAWDVHAFTHQPWRLFDANIFFPFHNTLAFSENLIGSALTVAPVLWVTRNPVLAMNVAALLTIPLCGLGAYVLARRVGVGASGAFIAGLVFAFSPPRFFRLDQLHLTSVQWIPFSLAYLHAYLQQRRARDARLAIAFFSLQAVTSGHGAVLLIVAAALLKLFAFAGGEPIDLRRRVRDVGWTGAALLLPAVLVWLPYRSVQLEMGLRRNLDNWHMPWTSWVAAPTIVDTWLVSRLLPGVDVFHTAGAYLFPGVVTLALAAIGIVWRDDRGVAWRRAAIVLDLAFVAELAAAVHGTVASDPRIRIGGVVVASTRHAWRAWLICGVIGGARIAIVKQVPLATMPRRPRWDVALFYAILLLLCVWLSIGPPYGLWQYVYWLPGFNFIRAPSRFMILGVLALSVLAGLGFDGATRRLRGRAAAAAACAIGALAILECAAMPLPMTRQTPQLPAIDRWLATQPAPFVVAEVPVPDTPNITLREEQESVYILHSMAHWQKTVHGYSGLLPDFSDELYSAMAKFPDEESLRRLSEVGVAYVVVHDARLADRASAFPQLRLAHVEADGRVYALSTLR